jgi:hypothetical protein
MTFDCVVSNLDDDSSFGSGGSGFGNFGGFGGIEGGGPLALSAQVFWTPSGYNPCALGGCFSSPSTFSARSGAFSPPTAQFHPWSLGWQVSASGKYAWGEAKGVWDVTGGGVYQMFRHPINTIAGAMVLASAMPGPGGYGGDIMAQMQIYDAASAWGSQVASGDPRAVGQFVGGAALLASPFAKSNPSFIRFRAFKYGAPPKGAGGFGIQAQSVSNPRNFLRFDVHQLHFYGRAMKLVPHFDAGWMNVFKIKHFPWGWFQ